MEWLCNIGPIWGTIVCTMVFTLAIVIALFVVVGLAWTITKLWNWLDWRCNFPKFKLSETVQSVLAWIGVIVIFLGIGFCIWADKCGGVQ